MKQTPTILALASEFKGADFIRECKHQGCEVFVIANERFKDHPWPWDCIDRFHTMRDLRIQPDLTYTVAYMMRHHPIDRIVALDDYDVEHSADLREHTRLPGMQHSTARLFRDKLAMRSAAAAQQIPQPRFTGIMNHHQVYEFMETVPAPWILKPRTLAGSEGIEKFFQQDDLWQKLENLGDQQSWFLLEEFVAGEVFHVDSLCWKDEVIFSQASQYGAPPLTMLQGQGIFSTRVLPRDSEDVRQLTELNRQLLAAFGRNYGPSHSEFIKGEDGQFRFLETSARVAGGNIERTIECASNIRIWQEAAKMELADFHNEHYSLPALRYDYAGLIACPQGSQPVDIHSFHEQEIRYRYSTDGYNSLVVQSDDHERVQWLLQDIAKRLVP
ncbi:ATP-grasp domain-containing protein [Planctobacterium marinum]|uniref:ATP-grasp domain-containing protein n=1 Tax=Planctobacterium marinum TaxID=1631968 RepID=UPI001E43BF5E|nr:ATP-grasp domain-containing protein [Planctobacterium marinum]MCC2607172.1 ATP-grasp domain-containing protein [Planctobacterium marinum]